MFEAEARDFVNTEIAKLERVNQGKELRPWVRGACPAASEYWLPDSTAHRIEPSEAKHSGLLRQSGPQN